MFTPGSPGGGTARGWRLAGVTALVTAVPLVGISVVAHRVPVRPAAATQQLTQQATQQGGHQVTGQAAAAPAAAAPLSATDLALQLQKLYGQHVVLTAELMRSRIRNDPDLAQAANAAVGKNTRDLAAVIGRIAGPQAAKGFTTQWSAHVATLFNYARGLATKDSAVQKQSRDALVVMESRAGRNLAAGTGGALSAQQMSAALVEHVNMLMGLADAYAAGDYARSYAIQREAHAHMFALGRTVAAGFATAAHRPTSGLDTPRWQLESSLAKVLSEHEVLATEAMRARVTGAPDFDAAAQALDANTKDLAGTVGAIFGDRAGAGFQSLWADHVDAFVAYTDAVRSGDEAGKSRAKRTLDAFQATFSRYLGRTTNGRLPADRIAAQFAEHDGMLLDQIEAFAAKRYPQAHDLAYDAYQQVFGMSGEFAGAIADVAGSRLPRGGAQTGGGGTAPELHGRSGDGAGDGAADGSMHGM